MNVNDVCVCVCVCVCVFSSGAEGMANWYAELKQKYPEDSSDAFIQPANPTSVACSKK